MPEPSDIETARYVVNHPEFYHDQPAVMAGAWVTLMAAKGLRFDLDRLGNSAHLVSPTQSTAQANTHPLRSPRVAKRIQNYVKGLTSPFGGDAA